MCGVDSCQNQRSSSMGLCDKHYKRLNVHGDVNTLLVFRNKGKTCANHDCDRPARKVGLCGSHYTRQWRDENPSLANKNKQHSWYRRYIRKRNAVGSHTRLEWESKVAGFGGKCAYCKTEKWHDKDHIMPISKGGTDYIDNVVPSCIHCNRTKSDSLDSRWTGLLVIDHTANSHNITPVRFTEDGFYLDGKRHL